MSPLLLSLPDELIHWRGTAAELASKCNEVLAGLPSLADDAGAANERLVRHYVQTGALTAPEREGREALFGFRQIVEFLATRYLLKDGWPLAKVAELVRATDVAGLAELIPTEQPRTRAEEVLASYRVDRPTARNQEDPGRARNSLHRSIESYTAASNALQRSVLEPTQTRLTESLEAPLARATEISRRRVSLVENLKALGNPAGRPDRQRTLRIDLTPWCQVHVDARQLAEMTEDTPAILGAALTEALLEERIRKGRPS